jgi:hypothetical protein
VELESFLAANSKTFKKSQKEIIKKLPIEAEHNQKLKIEITSNINTARLRHFLGIDPP